MVKTAPSIAEGVGWIPDQEAKIHALWPKTKTWGGEGKRNRNSVVTNSVKTLEVVHIKKKKKT